MDAQIKSIRQDIENVQLLLIAIERQTGHFDTDRLISDAKNSLVKAETQMYRLEAQLSREPATIRQTNVFKMEQLKSDVYLIKNSLTAMTNRHDNRRRQAKEKEELLKQRFTANSETRVNLELDHELDMNEKLTYSNNMIDQLLVQGASVFEDLQKQKHFLFDVRGKFHFFTKSLGISDTTIQLIDKRVREDKKIFIFGVVCCLIFMFCFYYWWQN